MSNFSTKSWFRSFWTDIKGASTREGHPDPFPVELAERLIRMFSFAGDTLVDPFAGPGSTAIAALRAVRNSINCEIDPAYAARARKRIEKETALRRMFGAVDAEVVD